MKMSLKSAEELDDVLLVFSGHAPGDDQFNYKIIVEGKGSEYIKYNGQWLSAEQIDELIQPLSKENGLRVYKRRIDSDKVDDCVIIERLDEIPPTMSFDDSAKEYQRFI